MSKQSIYLAAAPLLGCALMLAATGVGATVTAVGQGAFPPGSPLIDFAGVPGGTEVNGASIGGFNFSYSLGNGNLTVATSGGPAPTNNVSFPNILSTGNASGVLSISLPLLADRFGYGYAVLSQVTSLNATSITLFNGATAVGSLSFDAVPDPTFAGGFAGVQSTLPFDRVSLTFNGFVAIAVDNLRVAAVPEPAPSMLLAFGIVVMMLRRWQTLSQVTAPGRV